jgi:hypothetical protein
LKHSALMNKTMQSEFTVSDPKARKSIEPFWKPIIKNNLSSAVGTGQKDYFRPSVKRDGERDSKGVKTEEARGYSPLMNPPSKMARKNGESDGGRTSSRLPNGVESYKGLLKTEFDKYSTSLFIPEYAPPPANSTQSPLKSKLGGSAADQNKGKPENDKTEVGTENKPNIEKKDTNQKDGYSLAKLQSIVDKLPFDPRLKFGKQDSYGPQKPQPTNSLQNNQTEKQPTQYLNSGQNHPSYPASSKQQAKAPNSPLQGSLFGKTASQVPSQTNNAIYSEGRGHKEGLKEPGVGTLE